MTEGKRNRKRQMTHNRRARQLSRKPSRYATVSARAVKRTMLGRAALVALSSEHQADQVRREMAQKANVERGYELHLKAADRRRRAGITRIPYRAARVA